VSNYYLKLLKAGFIGKLSMGFSSVANAGANLVHALKQLDCPRTCSATPLITQHEI